jgi:ATP-binding cassette subfamily B protein
LGYLERYFTAGKEKAMKQKNTSIHPYTKQFYKGNWLPFFGAAFGNFLIACISLAVSWLLQQLLDLIGGQQTEISLSHLIWITLGIIGLLCCTYLLMYHSTPRFVTKGITNYKEFVFQKLTKKSLSAFSGEDTSTYLSALTNDIQTIEQGYLRMPFTLIDSSLTFIGALALMLWYSPLLTLIALGLSLLPLTASILTGNRMAEAEKEISHKNASYTATLKDCLGGFSVIKAFQAEIRMIQLFKSQLQSLAKAQCKKQKLQILLQALASVAGITAQLGVFICGAALAISGFGITAGIAMIFVQLMNYVLTPIQTIPTCIAERKAAKALVEKISGLLENNVQNTGETQAFSLEKEIAIKDLSFGYEEDKRVLQHITCTFELGKKYAIVGASGSGKSTLLHLLLGAYSRYTGEIYGDNTELRNVSSEALYKNISVIQQNVFIFNASIYDNITMFAPFPKEDVEKAIALSGLSTLINEKGEQYLCGENGCNLSGGEKQRISIARSLLKQSKVLLVDEATAALDTQTAFQISQAILHLEHVTPIVITHRLEADLLKEYNHILTLKNGTIAEAGTFQELMEKKGYFYSLYTVSQ